MINVCLAKGTGGYFCEDIESLQQISVKPKDRFYQKSSHASFETLRQPSESILLGLSLGESPVFWGGGSSVVYCGKSGRSVPLIYEEQRSVREQIQESLSRESFDSMITLMSFFDSFKKKTSFHQATYDALSQSLIKLYTYIHKKSLLSVLRESSGVNSDHYEKVVLHASSDQREVCEDVMISHQVGSLPHGLIDRRELWGEKGEEFQSYLRYLKSRIDLRSGYQPVIHYDFHGAATRYLSEDITQVADFFLESVKMIEPLNLRIESPHIAKHPEAHWEWYEKFVDHIHRRGDKIEVVADEWLNTLEDFQKMASSRCFDWAHVKTPDLGSFFDVGQVINCLKQYHKKILLGGSCNETIESAEMTAAFGIAYQADALMAKPGMGVSEGVMVMKNAMSKHLAEID